jgi:hypothetical protein
MSDVRIRTKVIISEVLSDRTYRASLKNGKSILAYAQSLDCIPPLKVGDEYHVLMSLCDFDDGRLVPEDLRTIRVEHPVVDS